MILNMCIVLSLPSGSCGVAVSTLACESEVLGSNPSEGKVFHI